MNADRESNFAVLATLSSPVVLGRGYCTLDAVLGSCLFEQAEDLADLSQLPLAQTAGLYHASAAIFGEGEQGAAFFARGLSLTDLEHGPWAPLPGRYPHYIDQARSDPAVRNQWLRRMSRYDTVASPLAVWFGRGNLERVRELLAPVAHLGKKRSQGYGRVQRIDVREISGDYSLVLPDGSPARPVPLTHWAQIGPRPALRTQWCAYAPPYWATPPEQCAVPDRRIASPAWIRRTVNSRQAEPREPERAQPALVG